MRFQHIEFPVPGVSDLIVAILRRRYSTLELCLVTLLVATLLAVGAWWTALALPLATIILDTAIRPHTRALVKSWRAVRVRRRALNHPDQQEHRRRALAGHLATQTEQADYAWRVYIADAVTGKRHSVINDRALPKVQPLERLAGVRGEANGYAIMLDEEEGGAEQPRLTVPPKEQFAPDTLSPTMMNLNSASIAHASAEGAVRAQRRHLRAVEHAAVFGPLLSFAEQAVEALAAPVTAERRGWWPWQRQSSNGDVA